MKKIKISEKASNFFEYFGLIIGIGSIILTAKINKIFNIIDRLSYQLYECPGFFLCFVEYIPIVRKISPFLKDPFPVIVLIFIFLIICIPILLIYAYGFEIDKKDTEENK